MDPDYENDEEDDDDTAAQEMAAMMGFSGFGSQKPPAKKRKFNLQTDAYVDGQELAKLDKGGKKGQGSGGNTVPLGKTRAFGSQITKDLSGAIGNDKSATYEMVPAMRGNDDEIDLDEFLEDQEDGPVYVDTSKTPPAEAAQGDQSTDANQPASISGPEAQEVQARIDALLSSIEVGDPPGNTSSELIPRELQRRSDIPQKQSFDDTAFMLGGPRRQANTHQNRDDRASSASISRPSQRGERNPMWYIGYYDPTFNENPWEKQEKEKGLKPLCKWPENVGFCR